MSETPGSARTAGPLLGEHNRLVLADILGLSGSDVETFEADGVIGHEPTKPRPPRTQPVEEQKRNGLIADFDLDFAQKIRDFYGD